MQPKLALALKVEKVYKSCTTPEQIKVAERFADLASERFSWTDDEFYMILKYRS